MRSPSHFASRFLTAVILSSLASFVLAAGDWQPPAQPSERRMSKSVSAPPALSDCRSLEQERTVEVVPGTELAVSSSGQFQATWVHTPEGAELTILNRDTKESHLIELPKPALPLGVTWRIISAAFSPNNSWLAIRSVGRVWVAGTAEMQLLYSINLDTKRKLWPGSLTFSNDKLAITFWPPESVLADAAPSQSVAVDIYDAASGKNLRGLSLDLQISDEWTKTAFSPDSSRLAVLERPQMWPGSSTLVLLAEDTGRMLWEKKISAEDIGWTSDSTQMLALGSHLEWLSAENGKRLRESKTSAGSSEYQRLHFSEPAGIALGGFSVFSSFRRLFHEKQAEPREFILWNLRTGKELCRATLEESVMVSPWVTARGEIVALEQTYELHPPLRLLKSTRIVTYKVSEAETKTSPTAGAAIGQTSAPPMPSEPSKTPASSVKPPSSA